MSMYAIGSTPSSTPMGGTQSTQKYTSPATGSSQTGQGTVSNASSTPGASGASGVSPESIMQLLSGIVQLLQYVIGGAGGAAGAAGGGASGPYGAGQTAQQNPYANQLGGAQGGGSLGASAPGGLKQYSKEIDDASAASGIPANVLGGMIWQESRGNLQAVTTNAGNGLTDTGLMQVNPNTYKELQQKYPALQGRDNLSDPATNIMAGAFYMKDQMDKYGGSMPLALRAYNSGPNGVDPNNPNATPAGTGDPTYVTKVMSFADMLSNGQSLPA